MTKPGPTTSDSNKERVFFSGSGQCMEWSPWKGVAAETADGVKLELVRYRYAGPDLNKGNRRNAHRGLYHPRAHPGLLS